MRNIHSRRRFRALLAVLLVVSFIVFFENRIEAFAPQFKGMVEGRIGEIFGRNVTVSIGALKGGIVRPFMLHNVKMAKKNSKDPFGFLEIDNMTSNYRIWNFIFPNFLPDKPYIAVDFFTKNFDLSGFVVLEGTIEDSSVKGYIRLFGGDKIDVLGNIRNGVANITFRPKEGLASIEYNFAASGVSILKMAASHVKFQYFDVTGQATVKNIAADGFEGEVEARNIILNYRPFDDVRASYRISNGVLEVRNLDLGKLCYLNGKFGLQQPHMVDAVAVTDNVNLAQTLAIFNPRYASSVAGTMNSKWVLKGPASRLKSKVHLDIRKGRIIDMQFESLSADLSGDGPLITIDDSRITRESGSFTIAGCMDLARIGKDSLFENLKIVQGENTVLWDGYDTARWQDVREFKMKKKIMESFDVGFKQFKNDEMVDESSRNSDEYELSYNLHPNDSLKVKYSDGKNFFGLEHKDKF